MYSTDYFPQAGRVILIPDRHIRGYGRIENIRFRDAKGMKKFIADWPYLMTFLGGGFDYFADRPFFAANKIMRQIVDEHRHPRKYENVNLMSGWYRIVYPSATDELIHERLMYIGAKNESTVIYRQLNKGQPERFYRGRARHINRSLVIEVDELVTVSERFGVLEERTEHTYRGYAFEVTERPNAPKEFQIYYGVIHRESETSVLVASKLVVQFVQYELMEDEAIQSLTRTSSAAKFCMEEDNEHILNAIISTD